MEITFQIVGPATIWPWIQDSVQAIDNGQVNSMKYAICSICSMLRANNRQENFVVVPGSARRWALDLVLAGFG